MRSFFDKMNLSPQVREADYDSSSSAGDNADDSFVGTDADDTISGLRGNDTLNGCEGKDILKGEQGNDFLYGEGGKDRLYGGSNNDRLSGGANNDTLIGQGDNDTLVGGAGNDVLTGDAGNDRFVFGNGNRFDLDPIGIDTITDFLQESDRIALRKVSFTALNSATGTNLLAEDFATIRMNLPNESNRAGVSNAKIVYNLATGSLFYNPDGANPGLADGGLFATVDGNPSLNANDFFVQA